MKKLMVVCFILLVLICTSCAYLCSYAHTAASGVAVAVGSALKCKRVDLIEKDLKDKVESIDACRVNKKIKGPVAVVVCPIVVPIAVSMVANQVPAKYECDTTMAEAELSAALVAACNLIPF